MNSRSCKKTARLPVEMGKRAVLGSLIIGCENQAGSVQLIMLLISWR